LTDRVVVSPEYVGRRLWAVCDDAREVHCAPLLQVNVGTAKNFSMRLCKKRKAKN
jgi:hypothetical protein